MSYFYPIKRLHPSIASHKTNHTTGAYGNIGNLFNFKKQTDILDTKQIFRNLSKCEKILMLSPLQRSTFTNRVCLYDLPSVHFFTLRTQCPRPLPYLPPLHFHNFSTSPPRTPPTLSPRSSSSKPSVSLLHILPTPSLFQCCHTH